MRFAGPYPPAIVGPDLQVAGGNDMAMQRINESPALRCDERPSPAPKLATGSVELPKLSPSLAFRKTVLHMPGRHSCCTVVENFFSSVPRRRRHFGKKTEFRCQIQIPTFFQK
jgi:hypothetical protein